MLSTATLPLYVRTRDTVNSFRVAVLATIAFLALLVAVVGVSAAIFDVSDRGMTVISVVITGLLSLLPTVIVYLKVDGLDAKADDAKTEAAAARVEARRAAQIGAETLHDLRNDAVKDKVKQAISEDRHMLRNRESRELLQSQLEDRAAGRTAADEGA